MNPEISIVMPAIRTERWDSFYDSLCLSTKREFELIIVGPYSPKGKLESLKNIKYIKDFGCPTRCLNIGLLMCEGPIFFGPMADDAILRPGMLDKIVDFFLSQEENFRNIVSCRSVEGPNGTEKILQPTEYYQVNGSPVTSSPLIPNDWLIMNGAIARTSYIQYLGGWDSQLFQGAAMAVTDLAIRAQIDGAKIKLFDDVIFELDHMPGTSGDHAPIHYSQILEDEPKFKQKYTTQELDRISPKIHIMNWRNSPQVWERRFK